MLTNWVALLSDVKIVALTNFYTYNQTSEEYQQILEGD
jgi:hypothetical protein